MTGQSPSPSSAKNPKADTAKSLRAFFFFFQALKKKKEEKKEAWSRAKAPRAGRIEGGDPGGWSQSGPAERRAGRVWSLRPPEASPRAVLCSSSHTPLDAPSGHWDTSPRAFPCSPTFYWHTEGNAPKFISKKKKILEHSHFFLHPLTGFHSEKYYKNMVIYNR